MKKIIKKLYYITILANNFTNISTEQLIQILTDKQKTPNLSKLDTLQEQAPIIDSQIPIKPESPVNKKIKDMTLEEAKTAKKYYLYKKNNNMLAQSIERITAISTDHKELKDLLLELADTYFQSENWEKSQEKYKAFVTAYPGSPVAIRAYSQEIISEYKQMPDFKRDQTCTENIIKSAENFFKKYPKDEKYTPEIKKIYKTCYQNIFDHEFNIAQQYLSKDNWSNKDTHIKAAQNRLEHINKKLLAHVDEQNQNKIKDLELQLNQAQTFRVAQADTGNKSGRLFIF